MAPKPVAVVTGSSTGIGLQICLSLARRNYQVVATLRTPSTAPPILNSSGCDVQPLDVTSPSSASALVAHLSDKYGGCDILINNAGLGIPGTLETWTIEAAKNLYEVNVWGVVRMCQSLVPFMRKRGGGLVLTVSSTSGWRGLPCSDAYASSKHAIEGMMDSFRYSVQKDNIKVCIVNPGPTDTPFAVRFEKEKIPGQRPESDAPEISIRLTQHYIKLVAERNSAGQKADDCAAAISDVVDKEFPKRIDDGSQRATFWNPTSEYAKGVLKRARVFTDGASGPDYDAIFSTSLQLLEQLHKEEAEHSCTNLNNTSLGGDEFF